MVERPALPSKTRETIDADFTGMFDPLTRGKIGELFGTTTNLTPDDIFNGKIVIINIPVARNREVGQFAALIWAQLFQRAVDRRTYTPPRTRPVFLWEDEVHYFTIEQDALFQTTARSKGISVVRLTQNIPNFLDAYGRDGKHKVDTLLGNHATKIFHRNGDPTTNEWASKVAVQVYHRLPVLNALRTPQAPMLVAALTIGTVFFIFTIPLAYWLAGVFSRADIKRMERQIARLKRLRIERKIRGRNDDDFKVG